LYDRSRYTHSGYGEEHARDGVEKGDKAETLVEEGILHCVWLGKLECYMM
jgi:hypothetical protein